jgi:hypothetical protein
MKRSDENVVVGMMLPWETFLPLNAWRPLSTGWKQVRRIGPNRVGGSSLPCRGQEAPQSALGEVLFRMAGFVNRATQRVEITTSLLCED